MTLHLRFFLFVLLISSLQPGRLAASTPGAEDFFKYVAEEGGRLLDEVTGEEDSINQLSPLNAVQPVPQVEEGISYYKAKGFQVESEILSSGKHCSFPGGLSAALEKMIAKVVR